MDAAAQVLFGKTRKAVLGLLFGQVGRTYYLREIARLTGISSGSVHHELGQLAAAGLLATERDGNRLSYRANPAHPIFEELRGIVHKTCGVPALIGEALVPLSGQLDLATVYGSFAKGLDHAGSDVDVLVVGQVELAQVVAALAPVEDRIGREVNVRLLSRAEFKQRATSDAFVRGVLAGPLVVLLGSVDDAG